MPLYIMTPMVFHQTLESSLEAMVYNYDSAYQCYRAVPLRDMFPVGVALQQYALTDQRNFDINYANYLMSNYNASNELIMLVHNLAIGCDVVILIREYEEEWAQMILESYLKFIQSRYGIKGNYVFTLEDYDSVDKDQRLFSYTGLFYWEQDRNRIKDIIVSKLNNSEFRQAFTDMCEACESKL